MISIKLCNSSELKTIHGSSCHDIFTMHVAHASAVPICTITNILLARNYSGSHAVHAVYLVLVHGPEFIFKASYNYFLCTALWYKHTAHWYGCPFTTTG